MVALGGEDDLLVLVGRANARDGEQGLSHPHRDEAEQRGVDPQRHLGRMRGPRNDVEHVADAVRRVPTYCYQCVAGPDLLRVKVVNGVATEIEPNFDAAADTPAAAPADGNAPVAARSAAP